MLYRRFLVRACALLVLLSAAGLASSQDDNALLADATRWLDEAPLHAFDYTLQLDADGLGTAPLSLYLGGTGLVSTGEAAALDVTVAGSVQVGTRTAPAQAQARLIDGVLYLGSGDRPIWSGLSMAELAPIVEDVIVSSFRRGFAARGGDTAAAIPSGSTADPRVREAVDALKRTLATVDVAQFTVSARAEDETLDGAAVAHFVTTLSLADLMQSGDALSLVVTLLQIGDADAIAGHTGAELNTVRALVGALLADTAIRLDRYVDLERSTLARAVLSVRLRLDPGAAPGAVQPVRLDLSLDVRLRDAAGSDRVALPERTMMISGLAGVLGLAVPSAAALSPDGEALLAPDALQATPAPTPAIQQDAAPIAANAPTVLNLLPGGPTDLVYTATGPETVTVVARSLEEPGTVDPTLEVLTASGTRLTFNDDHLAGRRDDLQSFDALVEDLELPGAGTYVIRINTFTEAAEGRVEVTVDNGQVPVIVQVTPGAATTPVATAVSSGEATVVRGEVPRDGEYTYRFTGTAGQRVTIAVRADAGSDFDPKLFLTGPNGRAVAENDDHGTDDRTLGSFDSLLSDVPLPDTGEYKVAVAGFAGSAGTFELTITFGAGVPVTPGAGPEVGQERAITGEVDEGEAYTHTFFASAGDVMTLTVRRTDGTLDPVLELYGPGERYLAGNDDHGSGDRSLELYDSRIANFIFREAGDYSVDIRSVGTTSGRFTLGLMLVASGAPTGEPEETAILGEVAPGDTYETTVDVRAGDYVTVTARGISGDLDPSVVLRDASGQVLADNEDFGAYDGLLALYDARVTNVPIAADGTLTVAVGGYQDTAGEFALTIGILR